MIRWMNDGTRRKKHGIFSCRPMFSDGLPSVQLMGVIMTTGRYYVFIPSFSTDAYSLARKILLRGDGGCVCCRIRIPNRPSTVLLRIIIF